MTVSIPAETLHRQIEAILTAWGVSAAAAATAADALTDADLHGVDSHGIGLVPMYDQRRTAGRINVSAEPRVVREKAAVALIDADKSLGHPVSVMAMDLACRKARDTGVALVGVRNSNHFGAAGYYSRQAAKAGLIGMAMTHAPGPAIVPTFGRDAAIGTNPIAFAAPAERNKPFALDMATSTVAVNKLRNAYRRGKPIPEGWAMDEAGHPTTNAETAFKARRVTPVGGTRELGSHKGYGLAMMVEILCAVLTGAWSEPGERDAEGRPVKSATQTGHFFLAIDPAHFREADAFGEDLDRMIDMLHATPPVDPARPVQVAGDPEWATFEERSREGVPLPKTLLDELREVVGRCNAPWLLGG
ncbi:MAG TPA: Ldh family oxidoreductase [Alphaproteobacteria bacterium]|nr:Ldh family oxidoreductase [Alphaproteobacteria bacterium]